MPTTEYHEAPDARGPTHTESEAEPSEHIGSGDAYAGSAYRATAPSWLCPRCNGTGWTEATEIYQDGSYATGRRCPRGCAEPPESEGDSK